MARPTRLAEAEVAQRLAALPGWRLEGGKLHRELTFADFGYFDDRVPLGIEDPGSAPACVRHERRGCAELARPAPQPPMLAQ
jgi:hypothetical protein